MMDMLLQGILKYSRTPVHVMIVGSVGGSMCKVRVEGVCVDPLLSSPTTDINIITTIYGRITASGAFLCSNTYQYLHLLMTLQRNTGFVPH